MTNLMSQFEFEAAGIPSTATILRVAQVLQAVKLLLHNQYFSQEISSLAVPNSLPVSLASTILVRKYVVAK